MALNNFTDNEAIEICISIRDNLALDYELDLEDRWRERDAMAVVINLAQERAKEKQVKE